MAPTKSTRAAAVVTKPANGQLLAQARKGLSRRTTQNIQDQNAVDIMQTRGKRKADHSPLKNEKIKRSALGNLTNNVKMMTMHPEEDAKQIKQKVQPKDVVAQQIAIVAAPPVAPPKNIKITTRAAAAARNAIQTKIQEHVTDVPVAFPKLQPQKPVRRISNEFNKTEESLYMSALEDVSSCESMRLSGNFEAAKRRSALLLEKIKTEMNEVSTGKSGDDSLSAQIAAALDNQCFVSEDKPPAGVEDFDKANWTDIFQVSHYAMEIFNYLKAREAEFPITDYMQKQVHLSKWMRSLLVDWMVEVQETFELNHETLYLAVKIVDLFLCRVVINKDKLQLLGAAALFIACKFDERTPPLIEDFLYICDGAYKHDELIHMEMTTLRTIDYDLGIPLSYRFLRRYARCAKVPMPTLTLARYILELSLMDYATICFSDSQMAAAALFMALRLHGTAVAWSETLEYYTGYKLEEFAEIVPVLNAGLHRKPKGTIKTIRSKYSHKIFHEVAKVKLLTTEQLFELNLDISASPNIELQIKAEERTADT